MDWFKRKIAGRDPWDPYKKPKKPKKPDKKPAKGGEIETG